MRDTHVLCNHYQLRYSTIIYYTSKRYSSCQCTLCARYRCSDDIDFASPAFPPALLAGSRDLDFFLLLRANLSRSLATRAMQHLMVRMVPRCGKLVRTVTKSSVRPARARAFERTRRVRWSRIIATQRRCSRYDRDDADGGVV